MDSKWSNVTILLDFTKFVTESFIEAKRLGASLWGIYPRYQPFHMMGNEPITSKITLISGGAYGIINMHALDQYFTLNEVEDIERTFKAYLRSGAVVRINRVMRGPCYVGPGYLAVTRTKKREEDGKRKLAETYPEFCTINWAQPRL